MWGGIKLAIPGSHLSSVLPLRQIRLQLMFVLQGVKFMYDCVTGVQIADNHGCIMADEMVL